MSVSCNYNLKSVKAQEEDKLLLKEPDYVATLDIKEKNYDMSLYGDKLVVILPEDGKNYAFAKYGLYNLEGKKLLDADNDEIRIIKDGSVYVKDSKGVAYLYDEEMKLLKSSLETHVDSTYDFMEPTERYVYDDKNKYVNPNDKNAWKVRYYEEIKAYYIEDIQADSGDIRINPQKYQDEDGNDVFENDFGIDVKKYLGNGYICYEKDGKVNIGKISTIKTNSSKVEKEKESVRLNETKNNLVIIVSGFALAILVIIIVLLIKKRKSK